MKKNPEAIRHFKGIYYFLRNEAPAWVNYGGITYPSVTHALLAARCLDATVRQEIADEDNLAEAKEIAKNATQEKDVTWGPRSMDVYANLLLAKFEDVEMREKLLATGNRTLVFENQNGDKFWGICGGRGYNVLGQMLMAVRKQLREKTELPMMHELKPSAPTMRDLLPNGDGTVMQVDRGESPATKPMNRIVAAVKQVFGRRDVQP